MAAQSQSEAQAEPNPAGHQLLTSLALLRHLAHRSGTAAAALVAAGAADGARRLWRLAAADEAVLHELLNLLAALSADSPEAREAVVAHGNPPLLQRIMKLVRYGPCSATHWCSTLPKAFAQAVMGK